MKTFFVILGILIASVLVYLGFYNAFYSPKFELKKEGGETIVYETVNGRYQLTDSVMKVVFDKLYEQNGIVITRGYGNYTYNTDGSENSTTTNFAGCIVEDKDTLSLSKIKMDFTIQKTPYTEYIVTDFPLKGKMSIMFGMYKVYPKLNKYCLNKGYSIDEPIEEIYDRIEKKIHYRRKRINN